MSICKSPEFTLNFVYMPFPLIPVIMGAVSLISSAIASRSSKKQTDKTADANMELAKFQAAANEKYLDKQNQYNTPANQMARFEEAGLNPDLIYSQGNPGMQTSAARYEAPRVDYHFDPFRIPEVLGPFQDYQMKAAQIDNVKAQTESTRTEIGNKILARLLTQVKTARGSFDLGQAKVLAPYNADIKHGQAQSAYTKLLQEFAKLDGMKLSNQFKQEQINQMPIKSDILAQDRLFNSMRNEWLKMGVTSSDHFIIRAIARALGQDAIQLPPLLRK